MVACGGCLTGPVMRRWAAYCPATCRPGQQTPPKPASRRSAGGRQPESCAETNATGVSGSGRRDRQGDRGRWLHGEISFRIWCQPGRRPIAASSGAHQPPRRLAHWSLLAGSHKGFEKSGGEADAVHPLTRIEYTIGNGRVKENIHRLSVIANPSRTEWQGWSPQPPPKLSGRAATAACRLLRKLANGPAGPPRPERPPIPTDPPVALRVRIDRSGQEC
jgi:hypothetical protein